MNWQLISGIILLLLAAYLIISGIGKTDFDKTGLWITRGLVVITSIGIMYFTIKNSGTTEYRIGELEEKVNPENILKGQVEINLSKLEKDHLRFSEFPNFINNNNFDRSQVKKLESIFSNLQDEWDRHNVDRSYGQFGIDLFFKYRDQLEIDPTFSFLFDDWDSYTYGFQLRNKQEESIFHFIKLNRLVNQHDPTNVKMELTYVVNNLIGLGNNANTILLEIKTSQKKKEKMKNIITDIIN